MTLEKRGILNAFPSKQWCLIQKPADHPIILQIFTFSHPLILSIDRAELIQAFSSNDHRLFFFFF